MLPILVGLPQCTEEEEAEEEEEEEQQQQQQQLQRMQHSILNVAYMQFIKF